MPIRSDLGRAAVDEQLDARDVATVVRGQEYDRLGDLVGGTDPAEGSGFGRLRLHLPDLLVAQAQFVLVAGRDDRARADDVDADVAALQVDRPGPSERPQRRL